MTRTKMAPSANEPHEKDPKLISTYIMRQNLGPVVQTLTDKYVEASQLAASQLEQVSKSL